MALYRDEGVVLRTVKLGEADRIITLLTRNHGRVRAVAKGVRRIKSRFGGRLEPFMRVDLLIAQGRSLDVISQAESISTYAAGITNDYAVYSAANVVAETVNDVIGADHERATAQYMLLISVLHSLSRHAHRPEATGESYVMRSLALAGWTPRLDACVVCGRGDDLGFLSVRDGGAMCSSDRTPDAHRFGPASRRQLKALIRGDWSVLDEAELNADVRAFVEEWGEYYLERPIRSLRLLDS